MRESGVWAAGMSCNIILSVTYTFQDYVLQSPLVSWLSLDDICYTKSRMEKQQRLSEESLQLAFLTLGRLSIGHVRYINILTWLQGSQVKIIFFKVLFVP